MSEYKVRSNNHQQYFQAIRNDHNVSESFKLVYFGLVILTLVLAFTCGELVRARHELRILRGEFQTVAEDVTEHDEMLETLGDDVTLLEGRVRP